MHLPIGLLRAQLAHQHFTQYAWRVGGDSSSGARQEPGLHWRPCPIPCLETHRAPAATDSTTRFSTSGRDQGLPQMQPFRGVDVRDTTPMRLGPASTHRKWRGDRHAHGSKVHSNGNRLGRRACQSRHCRPHRHPSPANPHAFSPGTTACRGRAGTATEVDVEAVSVQLLSGSGCRLAALEKMWLCSHWQASQQLRCRSQVWCLSKCSGVSLAAVALWCWCCHSGLNWALQSPIDRKRLLPLPASLRGRYGECGWSTQCR